MPAPASPTTGTSRSYTKLWAGCALLVSVVLHAAAVVFFIFTVGFAPPSGIATTLLMQDISVAPSLSSSSQPPVLSPSRSVIPPDKASTSGHDVQHPAAEQPSATVASDPSQEAAGLAATPLGLGMMHGYFSGLADGHTLREDIRGYYFELVESINRAWWRKAGLLREPLRQDGVFELLIQRDGRLVSIRMLQGTGSSQADRLLKEIINGATLPPLPASFTQEIFQAPLRIKAPSNLFRLHN